MYLDQGFESYIRGVLGNEVVDSMRPRSRADMMNSWEQKVKFLFGFAGTEEDEYEVNIPGIVNHPEVQDGFHYMTR